MKESFGRKRDGAFRCLCFAGSMHAARYTCVFLKKYFNLLPLEIYVYDLSPIRQTTPGFTNDPQLASVRMVPQDVSSLLRSIPS